MHLIPNDINDPFPQPPPNDTHILPTVLMYAYPFPSSPTPTHTTDTPSNAPTPSRANHHRRSNIIPLSDSEDDISPPLIYTTSDQKPLDFFLSPNPFIPSTEFTLSLKVTHPNLGFKIKLSLHSDTSHIILTSCISSTPADCIL